MTFTELKTATLKNVYQVHGQANTRPTEVIDLNIKTNVTVSNSSGSKFFQKSLILLVLFLTGTVSIVLVNVKRELQALRSQEQLMETKIVILMSRSEKLAHQLLRVRNHLHCDKYYQPTTTSDEIQEMKDHLDNINVLSPKNVTISKTHHKGVHSSKTFASKQTTNNVDDSNVIVDSLSMDSIDNNESTNANRLKRTILIQDENTNGSVKTDQKNVITIEARANLSKEIDELSVQSIASHHFWNEPKTRRMRRDDEGRGKIRAKNKRRPKRSRRRFGPLVATFVGRIPELFIENEGAIGPWVALQKNTLHYDLRKFYLVESNKAIEITMNGLYMISAQISYSGKYTNYSYWISLTSEGNSTPQSITKCSAVSTVDNEVSCHTTVVLPLTRGNRIHVHQQERNRLLNLREGHSYLQVVLLSNESNGRRVQ